MIIVKKKSNIKFSTKQCLITLAIVIVFFIICNLLVMNGFMGSLFEGLLIPMCYYVILAVSLNLTVGILGELSLGHAGFMCVGAYSGAIFSIFTKEIIANDFERYFLALLIGGICAGIFGTLIGFSVLRLRGDYLAIVTLAFGEITYKLIQNCYLIKDKNGLHFSFSKPIDASKYDLDSKVEILKGAMPVSGVPKTATLITSVILVLITLIVMYNLIDSRAGRAFKAIRDNSIAAESIGINISKYKLIVFFVSAFFAGIAGTMFSHYQTLDSSKFNFNVSILILVFVVLGGIGNIRGSVIATVILFALPEMLRDFYSYRMIVYAVILIVMMIVTNNEKCIYARELIASKIKIFGKKKSVKEEN